ncbi:MAG: hypothetical protein U5N10_09390 [Gemmobacter sp.]|nr:hypothetical protein [Gemmobacter sp.]
MFPDGTIVRNSAPVDLSGMQRFAAQWMADDRFGLNAYENGAAFGAPGHIHGAARGDAGKGGWLIQLGDASVDLPMLAGSVHLSHRNRDGFAGYRGGRDRDDVRA